MYQPDRGVFNTILHGIGLDELQMAAALITLAVPLIFFLILGQYFIRGILAGALKG